MERTQTSPVISFREWLRQYEEAPNEFGELANLLRDHDYYEQPDDSNFWHWYSFILHNFWDKTCRKSLFALSKLWSAYDMRIATIGNEPFFVGNCIIAHFPDAIDTGVLKLPHYAEVYVNDITDDGIEFIRIEPTTTYSFKVPHNQCNSIEVVELANDHFANENSWNDEVVNQDS